jgi:hypothetical protein
MDQDKCVIIVYRRERKEGNENWGAGRPEFIEKDYRGNSEATTGESSKLGRGAKFARPLACQNLEQPQGWKLCYGVFALPSRKY